MSRTSADLRQAFLQFFNERQHTICPSGSLLPQNDPTLLFVNAGMVPFKDVFTGAETRPYTRATSSQKCIRISGKHNDLENVGPSPRHHTFFEMLGNFSFGDYFKEEAIVYAWDFVTKVLGLAKDRLVITYFKGENGVAADLEARDLWKRISGLPDSRIIGMGAADNFWQMGDTGPCGPCSEIHYYIGPNPNVESFGEEQDINGVGWMEIWNLVFMQFNRHASGQLDQLPAPSIDTGAGLERLACLLQGKGSNYDTDILRQLVDSTAQISGKIYRGSMSDDDVSMRVIADHARTTAFLIAEGITPERSGREYVLRRVLRRAIRHGHRLGIGDPFMHRIALDVVSSMGGQYPELRERASLIENIVEQEEVRFRQTIERGLGLLEERFTSMGTTGSKLLLGADAFRLYDTYGFPLDLTQVICDERGYQVDEAGYEEALAEARKRSEFRGVEQAVEGVYRQALELLPEEGVKFCGYEKESESAKIIALVQDGKLVQEISSGNFELITDITCFYGESGGQQGDAGSASTSSAQLSISDTQKPLAGIVSHHAKLSKGSIKVGESIQLQVDGALRDATRRNHSATHLLHWALRKVVGDHAQQKGSLVGPQRLRFDFTSGAALSAEQLGKIESLVNQSILKNRAVQTDVLTMEQARERGAMMLFEEKYGDTVRMLSIDESTELCGGIHARATGDIGLFKIISEQGVAAGVRRIVGVTGTGALEHVREVEMEVARAKDLLKAGGLGLIERLERLLSSEKELSKQVADLQKKLASGGGGGLSAMLDSAKKFGDLSVLAVKTEVTDRAAIRELAEQLRDKLGNSVVLVASESEGNAQLVLTVSKSATAQYQAGKLIKQVAEIVGGSGGGRPDMAQAGGTNPEALPQAIETFYSLFS